jgi:penicillin-binding protein 2
LATILGVGNENVIPVSKEITCPGKITVMQQFSPNEPGVPRDYVCWTDTGHGLVDFVHAIALSCDIYFYKVSGGYKDEVPQGLGIWRLSEYARAVGYGNPTGIELPGEASGLIPDPDWKRLHFGENWSTGDTYIASMGQGFVLATPLQVLTSFATIINNGVYMKPTIIKEVLDADGSVIRPFEPQVVWDVTKDPLIPVLDENNQDTGERKTIDPNIIALAKEGMHMVVLPGGTAYKEFSDFPTAAGKTGTAEYCDDFASAKHLCGFGSWPTHAWFVGYAPFDDPEIVVVAFVYNGGEGASVAAPIVKKVLQGYFDLKSMDATQGGS